MNNTSFFIKNSISGFLFKFITLIFPFITRTVIIYNLGSLYLGLNGFFTSLIQILNFAELGISNAIIFELYKPLSENDKFKVNAILFYYKKIYNIIGFVILLLGLIILPFLKNLIYGEIPANVDIYITFFIFLLNTVLGYFMSSYKHAILYASNKNFLENLIQTIIISITYIMQIIIVMFFKNYYLYVLLIPTSTIVINLVRSQISHKYFPFFYPFGRLIKEEKVIIKKRFRSLIGHKLGSIMLRYTDNLFISSFLGLALLAVYGNYFFILLTIVGILDIFYSSIGSLVGNNLINKTKKSNNNDFLTLFFIFAPFITLSSIGYFIFINHFINFWINDVNFLLPNTTIFLLSLYLFFWQIRKILLVYKDASGLWDKDFYKPYVSFLLNFTLNFVLISLYGLDGILLSTVLCITIIEIPWEFYVFFKTLKYFKKSTYLDIFVKNSSTFLLFLLFIYLLNDFYSNNLLNAFITFIIIIIILVLQLLFSKKYKYFFYRSLSILKILISSITRTLNL